MRYVLNKRMSYIKLDVERDEETMQGFIKEAAVFKEGRKEDQLIQWLD